MPIPFNSKIHQGFRQIVAIKSIDKRGFYIAQGNDGGIHYLYHNGLIYTGVGNDISEAFWPTYEEAKIFWQNWKIDTLLLNGKAYE